MRPIHIKASPKQMSRLRNGHSVRVSSAAEGAGVALLVHPERFDKVARVFRSGRGSTIQLSPEELQANTQVGGGIFGKQFDRFVKKTIGKKNTKALYGGLEKVAKPIVNTAIDTAGKAAMAYAPEAAPAIEAAKRAAKGYIDRPSEYQKNPSKALMKDVNPVGMAEDYAKGKLNEAMKPSPATGSGLGCGLGGMVRPMRGGAIRSNAAVSGRGSLSAFTPVAMRSDPYGANFAMNTQLPPSYVRGGVSFGSGLYL